VCSLRRPAVWADTNSAWVNTRWAAKKSRGRKDLPTCAAMTTHAADSGSPRQAPCPFVREYVPGVVMPARTSKYPAWMPRPVTAPSRPVPAARVRTGVDPPGELVNLESGGLQARHRVVPDELHDQPSRRRGRVSVEAGRRRCACDRPGNEGRCWGCRRPMRARRTGQVDLTPADARAYTPGAMLARSLAGSPGPAVPSGEPPPKSTSRPYPAPVCPTMGIQGAESRRQGFEPSGPRRSPSRPRWNDFPAASKGRGRTRRHGAVPAKEGETLTDGQATAVGAGSRPGAAKGRGTRDGPTYPGHVEFQFDGHVKRREPR